MKMTHTTWRGTIFYIIVLSSSSLIPQNSMCKKQESSTIRLVNIWILRTHTTKWLSYTLQNGIQIL